MHRCVTFGVLLLMSGAAAWGLPPAKDALDPHVDEMGSTEHTCPGESHISDSATEACEAGCRVFNCDSSCDKKKKGSCDGDCKCDAYFPSPSPPPPPYVAPYNEITLYWDPIGTGYSDKTFTSTTDWSVAEEQSTTDAVTNGVSNTVSVSVTVGSTEHTGVQGMASYSYTEYNEVTEEITKAVNTEESTGTGVSCSHACAHGQGYQYSARLSNGADSDVNVEGFSCQFVCVVSELAGRYEPQCLPELCCDYGIDAKEQGCLRCSSNPFDQTTDAYDAWNEAHPMYLENVGASLCFIEPTACVATNQETGKPQCVDLAYQRNRGASAATAHNSPVVTQAVLDNCVEDGLANALGSAYAGCWHQVVGINCYDLDYDSNAWDLDNLYTSCTNSNKVVKEGEAVKPRRTITEQAKRNAEASQKYLDQMKESKNLNMGAGSKTSQADKVQGVRLAQPTTA